VGDRSCVTQGFVFGRAGLGALRPGEKGCGHDGAGIGLAPPGTTTRRRASRPRGRRAPWRTVEHRTGRRCGTVIRPGIPNACPSELRDVAARARGSRSLRYRMLARAQPEATSSPSTGTNGKVDHHRADGQSEECVCMRGSAAISRCPRSGGHSVPAVSTCWSFLLSARAARDLRDPCFAVWPENQPDHSIARRHVGLCCRQGHIFDASSPAMRRDRHRRRIFRDAVYGQDRPFASASAAVQW